MLEKSNYRHNMTINLPDDYINGQGKGEVSKMKYGFFDMSWNGCEMIAIYNAMRDIGRPNSLQQISLEMYPKSSVLCGFFGSNPYVLDKYFKMHDIPYTRTYDYNRFFNEIYSHQCGICSFWNHRLLFSSLHTVMVKYIDGKITVFNKSNGRTEPVPLDNRSLVTSKKLFMVGYLFDKK
ncbi:MAG: hypothetical protein NC122_02500 [Faecalibacterium sp.]|nr:hypothetical protein [Ruminococcus sp.]MCM1392519.1 hypothetical protein [Ruminococcus sp.]MCM1485054.1 hypothetical protein [Faecalibacterium sp.]